MVDKPQNIITKALEMVTSLKIKIREELTAASEKSINHLWWEPWRVTKTVTSILNFLKYLIMKLSSQEAEEFLWEKLAMA